MNAAGDALYDTGERHRVDVYADLFGEAQLPLIDEPRKRLGLRTGVALRYVSTTNGAKECNPAATHA
jgi:hypothetical protein